MVQPFSLKDAPALIEVALPVQQLSAEAQKERKAGAGQTLTALGSYWKGRKPLILAKACILGCLLPATGNTAKDVEIFEKLMGIDDDAFAIRADLKADTIVRTIALDDIDPLADMASIVWGAGLRVVQAWYIATETTSELKKGGYVQGTVLMVVRKRQQSEQIYKDELVIEIRQEVERQINIMLDLNQEAKRQERYDNLFTDADLYMAGYAAALKVLTHYTHIGSTDMTQAALRPRQAGQDSFVDEMVELARNIAGQILVPEGLYRNDPENAAKLWEKLVGSDRFYLKMLDLEATGIHKLDNYQNFAKAFKVDYAPLMGNQKPNAARLKSALEFKKAEVAGFEFERSIVRSILYALYQLQLELETDLVLDQFWDNCRGRFNLRDREDIHHLCNYIALKLKDTRPEEASAARVFAGLLKTEHL